MTLRKAIEVLKSHQSWRLGDDEVHMQKPSVVTEALNTLLDYHIGNVNEMVMSENPTDHSDKWKEYQDWINNKID
jgi:thymidine kinase